MHWNYELCKLYWGPGVVVSDKRSLVQGTMHLFCRFCSSSFPFSPHLWGEFIYSFQVVPKTSKFLFLYMKVLSFPCCGGLACGSPWLPALNCNFLLIPNKWFLLEKVSASLFVLGLQNKTKMVPKRHESWHMYNCMREVPRQRSRAESIHTQLQLEVTSHLPRKGFGHEERFSLEPWLILVGQVGAAGSYCSAVNSEEPTGRG